MRPHLTGTLRTTVQASLFALITIACPELTSAQVAGQALTHALDSAAQAHVESAIVPGVSVAVVRGGEVLLRKGYGFVDLEWGVRTPAEGDASYEIGSVSKQFTAAAILLLAEEGRIDLDADVTEYIDFDTRGRSIQIGRAHV